MLIFVLIKCCVFFLIHVRVHNAWLHIHTFINMHIFTHKRHIYMCIYMLANQALRAQKEIKRTPYDYKIHTKITTSIHPASIKHPFARKRLLIMRATEHLPTHQTSICMRIVSCHGMSVITRASANLSLHFLCIFIQVHNTHTHTHTHTYTHIDTHTHTQIYVYT